MTTKRVWNPWMGCHKVSDGCRRCYMYREQTRYGRNPERVLRGKTTWGLPVAMKRHGEFVWPDGDWVQVCSFSDFFHPEADAWRREAFALMQMRAGLQFVIITKRPERIEVCLPEDWGVAGYPNVWLGVSVEHQAAVQERVPRLLYTPARGHVVVCEPVLGQIDLSAWMVVDEEDADFWVEVYGTSRIDWVICGGETGNGARRAEVSAVRGLRDQCARAGVAFEFKRWGGVSDPKQDGCVLDGVEHHGCPAGLSTVVASLRDEQLEDVRVVRTLEELEEELKEMGREAVG